MRDRQTSTRPKEPDPQPPLIHCYEGVFNIELFDLRLNHYFHVRGGGHPSPVELVFKNSISRAVVVHVFNPSTQKVVVGGSLGSRPA